MGRKKSSAHRQVSPRTRSQTQGGPSPGADQDEEDWQSPTSKEAEVKFYTTLRSREGRGADVQVVSKRKLRPDPETYDRMKAKFDAVVQNARTRAQSAPGEDAEGAVMHPQATSILWVTHFNVFLYATCFFIQVGTMPTAFAIAQLLGGPIYGRLGDLFGERLALMVAFASAGLSYFLMGISYTIPILFASRLPSVFMHVMQGSQMVVTYLSDNKSRATALSRLGFSYGIGMVVGPTLGGYVSKFFGEQTAALVAAGGSLISLILVFICVPYIPKQTAKPAERGSVFNVAEILKLLTIPRASLVLLIKLACGIPIGVLQSMFSVIAMEQFGLPAEKNGMMLSYIGVVSLFMQGIGISFCTKLLTDHTLLGVASLILTLSYYLLTMIHTAYEFLALLLPLVCALCLVNSILTAALTKTVPKSQAGTMLGLNMAVNSGIRSVAPTFGGFIMNNYGFQSLGLLGVGCNVVVLGILKFVQFGKTDKEE
eukprot:TCALIF_04768-PA protein Name:"Similar to Slc22a18 Solute carrier family 22 member 18 (Rattus norvegicus)" AED:0.25 eAED:0.25 QI:143/0.8/0.83/1/1/1/6/119/483